jgi:hypothetical protein
MWKVIRLTKILFLISLIPFDIYPLNEQNDKIGTNAFTVFFNENRPWILLIQFIDH